MELVKRRCTKEGMSNYYDVSLLYTHENKTYRVRVRPVFWRDMPLLMANAREEKEKDKE